jgi:hypothetical protein
MYEKLIWISAFMLVGALHGGVTVGDVERNHKAEVRLLVAEGAARVSHRALLSRWYAALVRLCVGPCRRSWN